VGLIALERVLNFMTMDEQSKIYRNKARSTITTNNTHTEDPMKKRNAGFGAIRVI